MIYLCVLSVLCMFCARCLFDSCLPKLKEDMHCLTALIIRISAAFAELYEHTILFPAAPAGRGNTGPGGMR